jgi:zinc transport system substrate-binding protein
MERLLRAGSRGGNPAALLAALVLALGLLPCGAAADTHGAEQGIGKGTEPSANNARVIAFCSIPPQSYLIERVGGDRASVHVLVGPGQSPHTFEPAPKQMAALAKADIYFTIGLPFEDRIVDGIEELSDRLVVIDTSEGIPRRPIAGGHSHGDVRGSHEWPGHEERGHDGHVHDGHEHGAGLTDPHVWLSPRNASDLARNTCDALKKLSPESAEIFDANLAALLTDLEELDAELSEVLGPLAGESVYVFHPAFGYFMDAYGLEQVAVEVGGMEPSTRELVELTRRAAKDGVRVIFVQPQFSSRSAEAIAAEIGGVVVPIDPLSSNYLGNLRGLAREIRSSLTGGALELTPKTQEER